MSRVGGSLGPGVQNFIHPCLEAGLYLGPLSGVGKSLTDLDIQIIGGLGSSLGKCMMVLGLGIIGDLANKSGKGTTLLVVL